MRKLILSVAAAIIMLVGAATSVRASWLSAYLHQRYDPYYYGPTYYYGYGPGNYGYDRYYYYPPDGGYYPPNFDYGPYYYGYQGYYGPYPGYYGPRYYGRWYDGRAWREWNDHRGREWREGKDYERHEEHHH
jgi:hypothetical protein